MEHADLKIQMAVEAFQKEYGRTPEKVYLGDQTRKELGPLIIGENLRTHVGNLEILSLERVPEIIKIQQEEMALPLTLFRKGRFGRVLTDTYEISCDCSTLAQALS